MTLLSPCVEKNSLTKNQDCFSPSGFRWSRYAGRLFKTLEVAARIYWVWRWVNSEWVLVSISGWILQCLMAFGFKFARSKLSLKGMRSKQRFIKLSALGAPLSFMLAHIKMPRFEIFSDSTLIGYSEFETGDPPMGVASGRFKPLPAYDSIKQAVIAAREAYQSHLNFSAKTSSGLLLSAQGGVQILDFSAELEAEDIEVHVLGIGYPLYQELFPLHVIAYENQFKNER